MKVNYETSNSSQQKTLNCNGSSCSALITTDKVGSNQKVSFLLFNDQNQQLGTTIVKSYSVEDKDEPTPTPNDISISSVKANPPSVKKGESIIFIANLDNAISNGYNAYLKFTDAPTVSEKLMTCNGTECSLSREMNGVGENRPFRVNLKKDDETVFSKDGSYSVEEVEDNIDISTCESYGSYKEVDKFVTQSNGNISAWSINYGYNQPYPQYILDKYPSLAPYHSGIDISLNNDTPIYSLTDGVVVKTKSSIGAQSILNLMDKKVH